MRISSTAFQNMGSIPARYTCDSDDVSPPLAWDDAPNGTKSFALIVDDPDAPDPAAPKMVYVHWVLYDIPASTSSLPGGATAKTLPAGTRQGKNDFGKSDYGGPCPPIGRHRYFHKLYALDTSLGDRGQLSKNELLAAIKGHVLGEAQLVGTYERKRT
ncbi:MAG TPA: YbhB/YbcL family Raf kinase inhibitor-like protein [Gemmatimonadaceae bacterium]|nr:YbhB/YbcL family Raf kinase inhibitor-like protein [Gemmatimonadaceae bacterium]